MTQPNNRPTLTRHLKRDVFEQWYWLKSELVDFARQNNIPTSGNKLQLTERLAHWLETGVVLEVQKKKTTSRFNWRQETLGEETIITDNYSNTQNVRQFMKAHAGDHFAFSNEFMNWMRDHVGHTLGDAVAFWVELDRKKREDGYKEETLPQNQFCQFSKDISEASPGITAADIRRIWQLKRDSPGPYVYQPGDEDK